MRAACITENTGEDCTEQAVAAFNEAGGKHPNLTADGLLVDVASDEGATSLVGEAMEAEENIAT